MLISLLKNTFRNLLDNLFLFDGYKLDHSAAAVSYDMTLIPSQPASISQVDDISGNGNHLFQSVSSLMPSNAATLNGLSVLKFDEDYMNINYEIEGIRTVIIVTDGLNGSDDNNAVSGIFSGTDGNNVFVNADTNDDSYDVGIAGNSAFSGSFRWCGNNNVSGGNVNLGNDNSQNVGPSVWVFIFDQPVKINEIGRINASSKLIGNIASFRAYTNVLSIEEIQKQEGFEGCRFGLLDNFPNDHPYRYDCRMFGMGVGTTNSLIGGGVG